MSAITDDEGEPLDELDQFVDDVRTVLNKRDIIEQYFKEIYSRQFQEEHLQRELNAFFNEERELARLFILSMASAYSLSASLTKAAEKDLISDDRIIEFNEFQENIWWADEAARAFYLHDSANLSYWTDKSIEFRIREGEVVVVHTMKWGLSEVHDLDIPLDVFVDDIGDRLQALEGWLEGRTEEEDPLPEEVVTDLEENVENVSEFVVHLMDTIEDFNNRE